MTETALRPKPRAGVMKIAAYTPGKSHAAGVAKVHKLSSNESALGAAPKALEALASLGAGLALYPEPGAGRLRAAVSKRYGLDPDRLICGNGSDELLALATNAFLSPGDEALYSEHGFLVYPIAINAAGGTPVIAPEKNLRTDVDAMLARVTPRTKLVFLANPSNPTGTYLPFDEVKRLHAGLPRDCLLVLDAAYAEFVRRNDYEAGLELVAGAENVLMTRTFSKIYGLAALRIGWAYGPAHIIDAMNRIRGPFNMNSAAILAGAAAIEDQEFVERALEHNDKWLEWLSVELQGLGLTVTPSVCNFLLVHFPSTAGKDAASADAFLTSRGLILRRVDNYGLPGALRLTIGTEEQNRLVVAALKEFLAS